MAAGTGFADEWLVYIGGGLEEVSRAVGRNGMVECSSPYAEEHWSQVPYQDVDLPTSAFISHGNWGVAGKRTAAGRSVESRAGSLKSDPPPSLR